MTAVLATSVAVLLPQNCLLKTFSSPKKKVVGKLKRKSNFRRVFQFLPLRKQRKAEWQTKTSVLKHIKLGPECRKKEMGRLAALLLQHWEGKVSIFRMEEVFQSYNIDKKPKLGQLEREGKEESGKQI